MNTQGTAADPVPRRANLSYADFATEYVRPNKPVVISDALQGWPAVGKWTPEFFRDRYSDKEFTIDGQTHRLGEFVDLVLNSSRENPAPYLRNEVLREKFPELVADINPRLKYFGPNWMARRFRSREINKELHRGAEIEFYLGGNGRGFPVLHWDGLHTHAFLMQIYGRKQFFVFGPDQTPFLYPQENSRNVSLVKDIENPDLERFPLFANARSTTFVLEPGEMLFIPSGWWHTTRMLSPSISLSINTADRSNWRELAADLIRRKGGLAATRRALYLHATFFLNLLADFISTPGSGFE